MNNPVIAGLDCGKDSVYVCILDGQDKPLKEMARSYKPLILKAKNPDDVETLLALKADLYLIEPTGSYSWFWISCLQKQGKTVKLVSTKRIQSYRSYKGINNKGDRIDAAVIAHYGAENYQNKKAFLPADTLEIRKIYLSLSSVTRAKNPISNQIGQRLVYEAPEFIKTFEESGRKWLEPNPAGILCWLAGREVLRPRRSRDEAMARSHGCGISEHTRRLAEQLCQFEESEYLLELALEAECQRPEYSRYMEILKSYQCPPRVCAAIISRIYPFEEYLGDGQPIIEYVHGENSRRKSRMTKRDRSAGAFRLSLGMGKILKQSGSVTEWKAGGSKYSRTALWQFIKVCVVIGRGKAFAKTLASAAGKQQGQLWLDAELRQAIAQAQNITPKLAALRIHFECNADKKGDQRVMATAGFFVRMLYKDLLEEFRAR